MNAAAECPELLALLGAGGDDEARAALVAAHIAACPVCAAAEAQLAAVVATYHGHDPAPLAPDRERRLFDFLVALPRPDRPGT